MSIPLKQGWQIKGGAMAKRRDMEEFGQEVIAKGIGRIRALNVDDQQQATQAVPALLGGDCSSVSSLTFVQKG